MINKPTLMTDTFNLAQRNRLVMEQRKEFAKEWMKRTKDNQSKRSRTRKSILTNADRHEEGRLKIGSMYLQTYDALTKNKLPYWDFFPLVLPFEYTSNGFYGLNLHYVPPKLRAQILDEILKYKANGDLRNPTANLIRNLARMPIVKPAIHRYLYSQIVGMPAKIEIEEWEQTIYLPLADWRSVHGSVSANKVYRDSSKRM